MPVPGERLVSLAQLDLEMVTVQNQIEAMKLVLRSLIESHPNPRELVNKWRVLSHDDVERSRPKHGHVGAQTKSDALHLTLLEWSGIIHEIESAKSRRPPFLPNAAHVRRRRLASARYRSGRHRQSRGQP